jgi:GntR family transcriptional repressor for pyruvate dehydrogenase complex
MIRPKQVKRPTAVEAVLHRLERLVEEGRWPEGRLPPERELAAELETSRATLREALRLLRSLGVVEAAPRRGTRLVNPLPSPLTLALPDLPRFASPPEILEARLAVEPVLAGLAAVRSGPSDWQRLQECVDAGRRARTLAGFERQDREFHVRLAQSAGNQPLAFFSTLLQGIRDEATWGELKRKDLATPGRREAYVEDHASVLAALRARDAHQARERMRLHLLRVQENLFGAHPTPV